MEAKRFGSIIMLTAAFAVALSVAIVAMLAN